MVQADYYRLLRDVCRESYYEFVKHFWHTIVRDPMVEGWHLRVLCNELQQMVERIERKEPNPYDLLINIAPGTSKSTICSIMITPWMWTRMPHARVIGASYTDAISLDLSGKSRMVVESPLYQKTFPEVVLSKETSSKSNWANTKQGARYAVATGGSVTGLHGHLLIVDDPLNPTQARSKLELETANTWIRETFSSRKVDKLVSGTVMIMQRLHQDDPSALFISRGAEVRHLCLPAVLSEKVRPVEMRQYYDENGLFDPVRMPAHILEKMKNDMGQFGYSGQMMQDPIPLGGGMFKPERINIMSYPPPDEDFRRIVRGFDKAASRNYGDWTVGVKLGQHKDGSYWILDVVRGQWGTEERERMIHQTAIKDGKKVRIAIEREPGSAGVDSAKETVKRLAGFLVTPYPSTGHKEMRADTFSVQVNAGNVFMVDGPYADKYKEELAFFPNGRHDDQVDASSLAFSAIVNQQTRLGVL